jgi:tetratricopeptide (TPR) repeat protein
MVTSRRRLAWLPDLITLLVVLLACCALTLRPAPATADPQVALEEARAAVARGDTNTAITHLEEAVAEDRGTVAAYRWLSRLYADKGLREKAIDSAAAAVLLDPEPADTSHLARLLEAGLPESMDRRTPDALPLRRIAFTIEATDEILAACPGARDALFIGAADHRVTAVDPRFERAFDRAWHGYVLDAAAERWRLVCVVHYNSDPGADRSQLAANCTGVLLRAACLLDIHLGPSNAARGALHAWLTDDGKAGAESWGGNIYLCQVGVPRSPAEWARQIIHECGHAALPGIDGFAEPEPWANGRLGEHLFARWLKARRVRGEDHPWLTDATLDPLVADGDRCVEAFLRSGPVAALLNDRSKAGMDYYLGFAEYVERAFGGTILANAMQLTAGNTAGAFAVGVQQALQRAAVTGITLRAWQQVGQATTRQWVYLRAGKWRAKCDGSAAATFNGRQLGDVEADIGRVGAGWHSIVLPPGATVRFTAAEV